MSNQLLFCFLVLCVSCAAPPKTDSAQNMSILNSLQYEVSDFDAISLNSYRARVKDLSLNTENDSGLITKTGLVLGNTNYSMRIETIDSETLLSMPQKKVNDEYFYIPNHTITTNPKD